jgi:SAM-dependent methyltransferase
VLKHIKSSAIATAAFIARNPLAWRFIYWIWRRKENAVRHPIDVTYGIRTSGSVPPFLISPRAKRNGEIGSYSGCRPNCLRRAMATLPAADAFTFYDLGCGKGRALAVASEFAFKSIIGIEMSEHLCAIAADNAALLARRYPDRPPISVVTGDAAEARFVDGNLVVYFYHSFGRQTLARVVAHLEAVAAKGADVAIVYENPVYGDLVDSSPLFSRWHGEQVDCDPDERGFYHQPDGAIVVWRCKATAAVGETGHSDFDIVITIAGARAVVNARPL